MVRIQDGSSSWFVESTAVEGKLDCRVPWWVWQVELDGTSVALSVGQNEVSVGSIQLSALRDEPLMRWLPCLRPYEVSQLSFFLFVVGFIAALRLGYGLPAAACLTLIPALRVCPELPLLRSWPGGRTRSGLLVVVRCGLVLWIVLLALFWCKGHRLERTIGASISAGSAIPVVWPAEPESTWVIEEPTPVEEVDPSKLQRVGACFFWDVKYEPLNMPGYGRTRVRSVVDCQARCARSRGCAYFTAIPIKSGQVWCHLQEYGSQLKYEYGAVAGPGDCNQEALLAEALGRPSPTKAPAPKPPMAARPQPEAVKPAPAPVQVVKEPGSEEPEPSSGDEDGSLTSLLLILGAGVAISLSGRLERSA